MKYGFFDDAKKEYVINNPKTPYPWINYLGSQEFFTLISNTAGGYSFFKDARLRRITRYRYNNAPIDMGGKYFYINDGECVWSPGWSPVKTELDSYTCRHGMGYTVIQTHKAFSVRIKSVNIMIYRIESEVVTAFFIFGYMINSRAFNLNLTCVKIPLEILSVVLSIPQTPFNE